MGQKDTKDITAQEQLSSGKTQIFCLTLALLVLWRWYRWAIGYLGIKTGYTTSAGGCLSSLLTIKTGKYESEDLLMIVIGSTSS